MEDPFGTSKTARPAPGRFDAPRIRAAAYEIADRLSETWRDANLFSHRFRVSGWRRAAVEFFGEALTLSAAGAVVMLALAQPAFQATRGDWLAENDFAVTFTDRNGVEIGRRGILQRPSVPIDEMPEAMVEAVLATEDRRFFSHYGIDLLGLGRALTENVRAGSVVQGGSTITQQLAKNLFLSNERTVERKVNEAFLALWLEANLDKKAILQLYLDRAYMGGGAFGVSAAADLYFGKDLRKVTLAEAAMLAGLLKAPAKYAPHLNLPAARARASEVLTNMVEAGFLSEGRALAAKLEPAGTVDRVVQKTPDYFLDWAFQEAKRLAAKSGVHAMVAHTTIDMSLQQAAEDALEQGLRQHGREYDVDEGAIVLLDDAGAVRAMVGGRDYGVSQFNRATRAERQAGSSFKPYVYAVAMERGFTPESTISGAPIDWNGWSPRNYSRGYTGNISLASALARSINIVPVRLAKEHLGTTAIRDLAVAMGVESPISEHKTMVLGTSGMTVLDQATGYSVFANGGMAGLRHGIERMETQGGETFYDHARDEPPPRRVLSEKAVAEMNSMMALVPEAGTGRRAALPGIRSAGKTGTTQSYRDAWYVGFTGNFTGAVWFGNDDFSPTNNMTGGTLPAMVWQRLMVQAHRDAALKPIPGLARPFVDQVAAAKAAEAAREAAAAPARNAPPRPVMPPATIAALRALADAFRDASTLSAPAGPETLSAL